MVVGVWLWVFGRSGKISNSLIWYDNQFFFQVVFASTITRAELVTT